MSAPVRMTPSEVADLGSFLTVLSKASRDHHISVCAFGNIPLKIGDSSYLSIAWDDEGRQYVIDDRAGGS